MTPSTSRTMTPSWRAAEGSARTQSLSAPELRIAGTAGGFSVTAECDDATTLAMAAIGLEPATFTATATLEGDPDPCPCREPLPEEHCMIGAWTADSTDLPGK